MKTDFSPVILTDECRATLDGPDGWANDSATVRARRQQGERGAMFWTAIVGDSIIEPFRAVDGVKIDSEGHCAFLNKHFRPWWKKTTSQVADGMATILSCFKPYRKSMVNHQTRSVRLWKTV